jgi:ring-1,2-phenylacetyl-CoA epoxidase subunit PaaC
MSIPNIPQEQLLILADTCLLWGHRLSQWCGHGPALEEDIALTNTALDVIGHSRVLYQLVAQRESTHGVVGVTEDTLAYFRDSHAFKNVILAELPNGDYAQTLVRSLFLSAWFVPCWEQIAETCSDGEIRALAKEAAKASRAQLRHASDWIVRFGDGTVESRTRVEGAIELLLLYVDELLLTRIDDVDHALISKRWRVIVNEVFANATLATLPSILPRKELGSEERRHRIDLLSDMQSLARQHPNAVW